IFAEGADKKDIFKIKNIIPVFTKKTEKKFEDIYFTKNCGINGKIIYLDGARIYFPGEVFELMPLINKDAVGSFDYYIGNFPSDYGEHTAPVTDIKITEGNMHMLSGKINSSFFGSGINIQGPIQEGKSSFFAAGRKSTFNNFYTDIFRKDNSSNEMYWSEPSFWDLNLKYTHRLTDKSSISANFFHNYNGQTFGLSEDINDTISQTIKHEINSSYANTTMSMLYKYVFSDNLTINAALIFNRYDSEIKVEGDSSSSESGTLSYINSYYADYKYGNGDAAVKISADYNLNNMHIMSFGISAANNRFRPVDASLKLSDFEHSFNTDTTWNEENFNTQEYVLFARDKFRFNDLLFLDAGIRLSAFSTGDGKNYYSAEPRIFVDYKLLKFLSLNIAYAGYKQYIHFISNDAAGLTADIFIPSTKNISPEYTNHFAVGASINLPFDIKLKGTAFLDNISDMPVYKDNFGFFNYPGRLVLPGENINDRITEAEANYTGIITELSKKFKDFSIKITHTISDFSIKSDSINSGESFQYRYNKRHDFNIKISHTFNETVKIYAEWIYRSGNYVTLNKQYYIPYEYQNASLGTGAAPETVTFWLNDDAEYPPFTRNDFQLPAYHRLDAGIEYIIRNHTLGLHIYNIYNKQNKAFADYKKGVITNSETNRLVSYANIPFFPAITYSYHF
ncbi:MAG: TonB-dependent receptor, partial [Chlorobi bacterium]|nr:TonB-dependent receptor [Chlorobiota bacterium]